VSSTPDDPAEPSEEVTDPADRPVGVDDFGTTVDEQRTDEPLDARLDRERDS
jgi:hypothetical protein